MHGKGWHERQAAVRHHSSSPHGTSIATLSKRAQQLHRSKAQHERGELRPPSSHEAVRVQEANSGRKKRRSDSSMPMKPNDAKQNPTNAVPKHEKKMPQKSVGRPTILNELVFAKLEDAFRFGATKAEACLWAGIDPSTLWRYEEKNPDFAMKIEAWQNELVSIARANVARSIRAGNVNDSWVFLKAKRREEFAEQKNIRTNENVVTVEELEEMARNGVVAIDPDSNDA